VSQLVVSVSLLMQSVQTIVFKNGTDLGVMGNNELVVVNDEIEEEIIVVDVFDHFVAGQGRSCFFLTVTDWSEENV